MSAESHASSLYMLRRAAEPGIDWEALYHCAVAAGREETVALGEERLAATDELLVRSLREFVRLGELAAYASLAPLEGVCRRPPARTCAGVLRLLDRALCAHGRDVGYDVEAWREQVTFSAHAIGAWLEHDTADGWPLAMTLLRAADRIAAPLTGLSRDRIGVPERLAEAASELLLVYAAAVEA